MCFLRCARSSLSQTFTYSFQRSSRSAGRPCLQLAGLRSPRARRSRACPQRVVQQSRQLRLVATSVDGGTYSHVRRSGPLASLRAGRPASRTGGWTAPRIPARPEVPVVRKRRHQSGVVVSQIHAKPHKYVIPGLVDLPILLLYSPPLAAFLQRVNTAPDETRVSENFSSDMIYSLYYCSGHSRRS